MAPQNNNALQSTPGFLSAVTSASLARGEEPLPTEIVGTTGLRSYGGFVDEEFLPKLRGIQGVKFYSQMMNTNSVLGAIMFIIESLVRQVPWKWEAASDNAAAKEQVEFIEGCFNDMSHTFEDVVSEILSFLGYGWSYFELVYKLRKGDTDDPTTRSQFNDGKVGIRKIEIRSQDTLWQWAFDPSDNGLRGMVQMDPFGGAFKGPVMIPIEKALLFRTRTTKNNPEGRSLLRPSVRDYHYLTRIQEIEAIGIERDLAGMPVFEVPPELLMSDAPPGHRALRALLERMIQQVRVDERFGGLIPSEVKPDGTPSQYKFKLMSSGGKRMIDTNEIVKRYESRIAMTFLAEFIMIGQEKVGTQTLFQGKSNLFGIALGTMLDIISTTFNRHCVPRLMKLNNVPRELWPKLSHGDVASPDLEKLGKFVNDLGAAGILSPNRELEGKLLQMANLPPPDEEDLGIFDDPNTPTPATSEGLIMGVLADSQIKAVMDINEKLADAKISRSAATKLVASLLGVSPETAAGYIEMDGEQAAHMQAQHDTANANKLPAKEGKDAVGTDAAGADNKEPPQA